MKRAGLALLFAVSCRRATPVEEVPPPPAQPEVAVATPVPEEPPPQLELLTWSTVAEGAAGPVVQIRQRASAPKRCRAEVTVGGEPRWSVDRCLATRLQLRFLSPDGAAVLVLDPAPELSAGQPAELAVLGRLWRQGAPPRELTPSALRLSPGAVRPEGGIVRWLGERDQRASAQAVEVQLADGTTKAIRFDGADLAAPPAPAVAARGAPPPCNPCSYTDDQGTFHMVENADEIPAKYRKRASRVRPVENRADAIAVSGPPPVTAEASATPVAKGMIDPLDPAEIARRKAEVEARLHPQPNHYERVMQLVDPEHRADPYRDNQTKIHCTDPDHKEIPCPN